MDPAEEAKKKQQDMTWFKMLLGLLSPLLLIFIKAEPGLLISVISLFQGIFLRVKALQGRRKVYVLEAGYLWVFPLAGVFLFLLAKEELQAGLLVLSYVISLVLPKKDRLPVYLLLQGMMLQAFLVPQAESSFYSVFLPALYGLLMMVGGLGILERRK